MMNWVSLIQQILNGINPTILAALIGAVGIIVGALIEALISHRLQQRNKVKEAKERERQYKEQQIEATKTTEERIKAYRNNLRTDPRIAFLQILGMSQPLAVTSIYVRLRLYKEVRSENLIDQKILLAAEDSHDPYASLEARHRRLEDRVSKALDPNEAIREHRHCLIVGDPGAGKTTLLKYLIIKSLYKELKGLPDLPIYIELKAFASSNSNDLLEFIDAKWVEQYSFSEGEVQAYLTNKLQKGNILVLLDGLDETFIGEEAKEAEKTYGRISKAILRFRKRFNQSPIVVTVRKAGYKLGAALGSALDDFTELEVLDFRPEDIQQFVYNWFACYNETQGQAKDLNNKLKRNPRIQALAANPLLLSLITIVYETNPNLLDRRADLYRSDLYKECVDTLLAKWDADAKRRVNRLRKFTKKNLELLLEEVALHFHIQRRLYFPKDELLEVIAGILPAMRLSTDQNTQILGEITSTNGLLKEQAQEWYGFLHLTFQEYFVARCIANEGSPDTLLAHSDEPWWEEVILLYAGYTHDASPLLRKLLQKNAFKEDIFHTDLILAGRCMAASSSIRQTSLPDEIITRLFDTLIRTPYSLTRQQIISTLIEIDKPEVNRRLIGLLSDQQVDKSIQELVIDTLGTSGNNSISSDLLPLLSDPKIAKDIRKRIAITIGRLGDGSQIDKLLQFLSDPKVDANVCGGIVDALGMLGEKQVIDKLLNLLTQQPDAWEVGIHIVNTLSKLGENTLAPILRSRLFNQETDKRVRLHIIDALGNLNDHSGAPDLLELLLDPQTDPIERICIADNLGRLGDDSTADRLRQFHSKPEIDPNTGLGIAVALTLVKLGDHSLGDHSHVDNLLKVLSDFNVSLDIRQSIAIVLVKLGDHSIIHQLLRLLSERQVDTPVRKSIVDTLGTLGDRTLASALKPLVSDLRSDPDIQGRVANTLAVLGERSIAPTLLSLLSIKQVEVQVRQLIADNLGELGEHSQIPDLLRLLSNALIDKNVRKHIANALGQLAADESTVRTLAELLQTSDIEDDIHRTLGKVSYQARVKVFMMDGPSGKQLDIHKW